MIRILVLILALAPGLASAQRGNPGTDCLAAGLADARFSSRALGDGRYLYQLDLTNRSATASLRYTYSFALPGSGFPAEALHGYLTPGDTLAHTLGTGDRNLSADAVRSGTTLRCTAL